MTTDNTTANQIWQDRFLLREYLPAGELARRFNLLNPRSHPESQMEAIESSLDKLGWIDEASLSTNGDGPPSLADNPDAVMFDGHERVELVLARGGPDALMPAKWYRLTPEETKFTLLVKDQTTGMAEYIPERLRQLLAETKAMTNDPRQAAMLEQLRLKAGVNGKGQTKDAGPQIDRAAQLKEKWGVCLGQVWELGEHRLICGDCTDKATVEQVMRGEKARLEFSDPPYEINTQGGGVMKQSGHLQKITDAKIDHFSPSILTAVAKTTAFCCNKPLIPDYLKLADSWGTAWDLCFWKKNNTPPNYGGHLMTDTEYIFLLGIQSPNAGLERDLYSKSFISDVVQDRLVGWQKPIGLVDKFIRLFSLPSDTILDRFCGSGTTIIAGENLGRKVRAIELDPGYAAVSIQRWVDATNGLTPTLVGG